MSEIKVSAGLGPLRAVRETHGPFLHSGGRQRSLAFLGLRAPHSNVSFHLHVTVFCVCDSPPRVS